jgi:hypothetical protein
MAEWNLIEMLANAMGNAPNTLAKQTHNEFVGGSGGQGYMPSAQASPMKPQPPSTSGPMGGPLQSADTIGHGVPPASLGRGQDFMRMLLQKPALPAAGERKQQFADFPRSGYDPTQRRY